ncbi:RNA-binding protein [Desulfosporosinus shakirovi]|uniref:hypothetical protein n=1 Tax=Desulfosporosinus shakirovi TaxID=2885154 RepID=UPI001E3310C6|nr:hypothetical protein [Desulfosporosinus sp. SRJS8]MCB8817094.1 hypothetical protein [Desulfosporosinus sp. SRJS8]
MKIVYKILIFVLMIALFGSVFYIAFSNQKTTISASLPDSETLEKAIAQYGVIAKTSLIHFSTGETYAVVCAVATINEVNNPNVMFNSLFLVTIPIRVAGRRYGDYLKR